MSKQKIKIDNNNKNKYKKVDKNTTIKEKYPKIKNKRKKDN